MSVDLPTRPSTDLPASVLIARVARLPRSGLHPGAGPGGRPPRPPWVRTARGAALVRPRLAAAPGPSELRQRQLVALSYLRDHGPARQQALAQSLCMDAPRLVWLLNDLEDRDLVVRRRDREDRRRGILELTEHGRESLIEVDAALVAIDAEILAD